MDRAPNPLGTSTKRSRSKAGSSRRTPYHSTIPVTQFGCIPPRNRGVWIRDHAINETPIKPLDGMPHSYPRSFNPARYDWAINSLPQHPQSLPVLGLVERIPIGNNAWGVVVVVPFDPTNQPWGVDSQRIPHKPYWTSPWTGTDWLTPTIATAFDASTHAWPADSQRMPLSSNPKLMAWTTSGPFVSIFYEFDIRMRPWTVESQVVPHKPYWTSPWTGTDWIPPEIRAPLRRRVKSPGRWIASGSQRLRIGIIHGSAMTGSIPHSWRKSPMIPRLKTGRSRRTPIVRAPGGPIVQNLRLGWCPQRNLIPRSGLPWRFPRIASGPSRGTLAARCR